MMKKTSLVLLLLCLCGGVQAQQIASYEYWFDHDSGQRIMVPVTNGDITLSANATALPMGLHTFHFRVLDTEGRWSSPLSSLFLRQPMAQEGIVIDKYEYWFDEDYNHRVSGRPTGEWIELAASVKTLTTGIHSFQFRVHDYAGRWSSPIVSYFLRVPSAQEGLLIKSYEYWFDEDFDNRVTARASGEWIALSIDVKHLPVGVHSFQFRAKDDAGRWSAPVVGYFLRAALPSDISTTFAYEYWFDDNDAQKMTGSTTNGLINLQVDASKLKEGLHRIAFCIRGEDGLMAPPIYQYFVKPYDEVNNKVAGYYYWYNDCVEDAQLVRLEQPASPLLLNVDLPTNNLHQEMTRENMALIATNDGQQRLAMKNVLSMKFIDERGKWSNVQTDTFAVAVGDCVVSLTPFLVNPEADEQWKGWNTQGERNIANADDHYSGKKGNYFRLRKGEMRQTVSGLPAGTYILSAYGRVADGGTLSLSVADYSKEFTANGEWNQQSVTFVTDGNPFDIIVTATGEWSSVDGFELTVNGISDHSGTLGLDDMQIAAISNADVWNEVGSPVLLDVAGLYTNKKNRAATLYCSVDNGTAQRLTDNLQAGLRFTQQVECFFRQNTSPHTLAFYCRDSEGVVSERKVIEIGNISRGCKVEKLPQMAIFTGEPITVDSLLIRDDRTGQPLVEGTDYTIHYNNNVDDGQATIVVEGVYPRYLGRRELSFTIKSLIAADELAVLRTFYQQTLGDSQWNRKWDVQRDEVLSDALAGVSVKNSHVTAIRLRGNQLTGPLSASVLALPRLQVLDLEDNCLSGIVNTQTISPTLQELRLAGNRLSHLSGPLPATVLTVSLGHQTPDEAYAFHLTASALSEQMVTLPNIGLYDHVQRNFDRDIDIRILGEGFTDVTPLAVLSRNKGEWQLRNDEWGQRTYRKAQGDTIYCRDDQGNRFLVELTYDEGDANVDGEVNVLDLSALVMYCLRDYQATFNFGAANLWPDDIINVQDAVCLVNMLLERRQPTMEMSTVAQARSSQPTTEALLTIDADGQLVLLSPVPVSAFDIIVQKATTAQVSSQLELYGFSVSLREQEGNTHLIGWSPSGQLIPAGETVLATLTAQRPTVADALLADHHAKAISVTANHQTGICEQQTLAMTATLAKGHLVVTTAQALDNVEWTLCSANGTVLDSGHADHLPAGISELPCQTNTSGIVVLRLSASGHQPIIKKATIR